MMNKKDKAILLLEPNSLEEMVPFKVRAQELRSVDGKYQPIKRIQSLNRPPLPLRHPRLKRLLPISTSSSRHSTPRQVDFPSSSLKGMNSSRIHSVSTAPSSSSSSSQLLTSTSTSTTPPLPILPTLDFYHSSKEEILQQIQDYINSFEYNYTVTPFYRLKKTGGTAHVLEIFRLLSTYGLPIQCVEAVFIGTILTAGWNDTIRIPICFKSKFQKNHCIYRHIVLAIYKDGQWGALGVSRREDLMFKQFHFSSLWELCQEYIDCYQKNYHRVLTIYCGLPLPHNFLQEDQQIIWKAIKFRIGRGDNTLQNVVENQKGREVVTIENQQRMNDFLEPFLSAIRSG